MSESTELYAIVINWVAERQREKKLSDDWTSVQSYNGDRLLTLHTRPIKGLDPYIIIYNDRFEAHKVIHARLDMAEVIASCNAADPKFFEILFDTMITIEART
jgi:hypothetical protein